MTKKRTRPALILPVGKTPYIDPSFPIDDLKALQAAVGGYIQAVHLDDAALAALFAHYSALNVDDAAYMCLVVNEEGKLKGLPVNRDATAWYACGDIIVGDALIVPMLPGADDDDGDDDE